MADRGSYRTRTHLGRLSGRGGRPAAHADADVNSCSSANDTAGLANLRNLSRISLYPIAGAAISAAEGACAARTATRNVGAVKLVRPQNDRNPGGGNRGFLSGRSGWGAPC